MENEQSSLRRMVFLAQKSDAEKQKLAKDSELVPGPDGKPISVEEFTRQIEHPGQITTGTK